MRARSAVCLAIALASAAGRLARADEAPPPPRKSFADAFHTFAADGGYLMTFPARTNVRGVWWTAGFVAATALAMNRDEEIRNHVLDADHPGADRAARWFEPLGRTEVEAAALGSLYLGGRIRGSEAVVSTAATAFEAYLWSALITAAAKGLLGRERPGRGSGEGEFFAGDSIFPSGHTARSFAIAAVFADRWGRRGAWVAYPIATLIGLATVRQDDHWMSDVVAGA